ncbi:MAG: OprO/OprP family phosphate-selective porin [Nitrospinaceae bacterium]
MFTKTRLLKIPFGLVIAALVWFGPATAMGDDSQIDRRLKVLEEKMKAREGDMRVYFKHGLHFDSPDKKFRYQIGGRIQTDMAFFEANRGFKAQFNEPGNGVEFRRARFFVAGLLYNRIKFKAQYDFAGQTSFKDVYFGLIHLPVIGNINVGHFKEPFSLEELTSSKYITFMERSLMNAFAPSRNVGIAMYNTEWKGRASWAVGVFRPTGATPPLLRSDDGYSITFRVTAAPWLRDGGKQVVHVGFSYSYLTPSGSTFTFKERPESHLTAVKFVNTGAIAAKNASKFGWEGAAVYGALSAQGEFVLVHVNRINGGTDPNLKGGYVEVSYFLTGEHRKYHKSVFGRVAPNQNFLEGNGLGAWQVALRYSRLDLNEPGVNGGEEDNITVGLKWLLNPNTRILANYTHGHLEGPPGTSFGDLNIYQFRFQVDF